MNYINASDPSEMNKRFISLSVADQNLHINHMIGREEDIHHTVGDLVLVWLGKRGCPMVINTKNYTLVYYKNFNDAKDACISGIIKSEVHQSIQISLF